MSNIQLNQMTYEDGTCYPASLQINDEVYFYGETKLFEKLINYTDNIITINETGFKKSSKQYIIEDIITSETKIPLLKLKDINEAI